MDMPVKAPDREAKLRVNVTRRSRLPPQAYSKLDPCSALYRMPLAYLLEAIRRIRMLVREEQVYVNPWTIVEHPKWSPKATYLTDCIKPEEDSAHYTSLEQVLSIAEAVTRH
ncbi:hypothetical protein LTR17_014462 [Elasticomyces elasticus]|nr:hypothetical protein LTR17_014462 [Elasticomyces elasticus]